jgi:hypothetical protein
MRAPLLIGFGLALAGCISLPQPTVDDVTRVQAIYPDLSLVSLTNARQTYVRVCSGCHALHIPKEFPAGRWPSFVDEMVRVQKVKLSSEQRTQIETFLVVMAESRDVPRR